MSKYVVTASWNDAPHLSESEKKELYESIPPYQREARTRGVPQLGAGAIYPFPTSEIEVVDFELPEHWAHGFGLDAQPLWKSSIHAALDRETGTYYIYRVFKREQATPSDHAAHLQAVGAWIPGVADAAAMVRDAERERYIDVYRQFGIDVQLAEKSVEAGIQDTYMLLSQGRLKVFRSCAAWFDELESYQRDEKGRIIKQNDHLMDSTRYLVRAHLARGDNWMVTAAEANPPAPEFPDREGLVYDESRRSAWMR